MALHDMGQGVCFRPGMFDGVISVSALQWICNADRKSHNPRARMSRFFTTLFSCMVRVRVACFGFDSGPAGRSRKRSPACNRPQAQGARAVFQFYPETPDQMELVTTFAMKAGFTGGIVIDFPNSTRARKCARPPGFFWRADSSLIALVLGRALAKGCFCASLPARPASSRPPRRAPSPTTRPRAGILPFPFPANRDGLARPLTRAACQVHGGDAAAGARAQGRQAPRQEPRVGGAEEGPPAQTAR